MTLLPVIPDELRKALERNNNEQTIQMEQHNNNKQKESIWNRIGTTTNNNNNNNIAKKNSTKQRQRKPIVNEQPLPLPLPTTTPPPPPLPLPLPPQPRARASFSFDHYIHSLDSSNNKKTQSRFIPSDIINGLFNNTKTSIRASVDQPHHHSSSPNSSSSSSKPSQLKLPSSKHLTTTTTTTTHSDRWSSTPINQQTLEDEITQDHHPLTHPWSPRENFTHQINPTRPTTATSKHSLPTHKSHPSRIPIPSHHIINHLNNNNNNNPQTTHSSSSTTTIHLPPNTISEAIATSTSPLTQPQQSSSRSRSQSVFSIPTTTTTAQPTSSSSSSSPSSAFRSPNKPRTTGGLRQQIEARRTLLLTSPTSPIQPVNQSSNQHDTTTIHISPLSKPTQHPDQQDTTTTTTTTSSQTISTTDTETTNQPIQTSSRSRSMSDTFVRKTKSFAGIPPHTHPRYSLHTPPQSFNLARVLPSQLTKEIILKDLEALRAHKHKQRSSCTSAVQPTRDTRHSGTAFDPIHTPQDILNLFESQVLNPEPSSSSNLTRGDGETDGDESQNDENDDDTLHLIDSPQARDALNVRADFVIGVAGPKGVGKSTIITRALRNAQWGSSVVIYEDASENRITSFISNITSNTTGHIKVLQVLEIDQPILAEKFVKKNNKEGLSWPHRLPHLDGVLLCYDAMDPDALDQLRPLLHSFWTRGGISLIVLACKSDKDEKKNATSPLKAAELVNVYGTGMIQLDGGLDDPSKKMRNSFNWIVKAIKEARGEHRPYSSASSTNILDSMCGDDAPPLSSSITAAHLLPVGSETSEELDQESPRGSCTNFTPEKLASESQPLTSPSLTPRRPTLTSLDLFPDSTPLVAPLPPKSPKFQSQLQADDADGDSLSNNALVAMSYEKSTRPDGSFKDDGSTSGSSQDPALKALDTTPAVQAASRPASPAANHPDHKDDSNQPSNDDQEDQSFPAQSDQTSSSKALSGPKKHAVQKAIAMSQRGVDMDLHFDKQVIIDKFVFATVSGNEPSFVDQFLIIFRRFATPFEVLSALIFRFEFVSQHIERDPLLGRYAHLKIGHVLMSWLETYPGDFVHPSTLTALKAFNSLMISVTWLLHYAMEIIPIIKMLGRMTDEDVGWALPDTTDESAMKSVLECLSNLELSLAPPSSSALRRSVAGNPNEELIPPTTPLTTGKSIDGSMAYPQSDASPHHETFASTFMSNDHLASTAASSPVHSFSPHDRSVKSTEEHKANDIIHHPLASLDPSEYFITSTLPLKSTLTSSSFLSDNKIELKALLDASLFLLSIPEEAIALQITRLEWNIFSQMKPRHLIRYVLAPRDPNNPRKALRDPNSPIAKSTDYLNYLAVWASSMILIHDKLKSRARVLLKLMKVAYELRDMDDFHSLMGVLAGIEAQPVYRLNATFEIVQHMDLQSYRRYLSLKKLMSSQRSFSAYRLARQTASSQCVPYLGTYLQDITAVNEVKDDMKDGKVNLTKMIQIAKSASSVLNCNLLAPKIVFDPRISNLIMKVPVLSEDAQYELSYKYKPRLQTSNHHTTTPMGNGSHGGSSSGVGGLMSAITAAAAATTGVGGGGSGSSSVSVHGGRPSASSGHGGETAKLSSSVSSGSLLPSFPLDPASLLRQSASPAAPNPDDDDPHHARPLPPSTPPPPPLLPPAPATASTSLTTTTTTTTTPNHASSLPLVALSTTTSLFAKKGTRKLKHFLSTAISSSSSASSSNPPPASNPNAHHHLSLPHH